MKSLQTTDDRRQTTDDGRQVMAIVHMDHGLWFSPGTPASSTTKTGRHDIAEILLKVALNTINQIKSNHVFQFTFFQN